MSSKRRPFMAFAADSVTRTVLAQAAKRAALPSDQVFEGTMAETHESLVGIPTPELLVVDFGDAADPVAAITTLADVCDEGTKVIALGEVNDIRVYRALIDLGVRDYLIKPVSEDAVAAAFLRVQAPQEKPAEAKPLAPIAVFFGARGGVGASSVALNCAWIAAHERGKRIAFVDMDMHFGSAALALDLEPEHGFRELIENPERIDELFIQRAMIRATDKLYLLSAEEDLLQPMYNGVKAYGVLLGSLRQRFDAVIVDLPRALAPTHADVLSRATAIGVVSDMTLHSLRDSLRLIALAQSKAPDAAIRMVVNGHAGTRAGSLDRASFERGLERRIDVLIPEDSKAFAKSQGKARTLIQAAPKSKAAAALRLVTDQVIGAEAEKRSLWRRMLKGTRP